MELIDQPLLMMAGAQADTLYMTQDCYDKATGSKDKKLFLVEGAHLIQTYFVLEYVNKIDHTHTLIIFGSCKHFQFFV